MSAMSTLLEQNIDFSLWTPEAMPAEPVAAPRRVSSTTTHSMSADEWMERTKLGYRNWQQVVRSQHRFQQRI